MTGAQFPRWFVFCWLMIVGFALNGVDPPRAAADPLLNLVQTYPDIDSGFIDFNFNNATGQFSANGTAFSLNMVGLGASPGDLGRPIIDNGLFSISMVGTTSGGYMPTAGSLEIDGSITGLGPVLLQGSLSKFGFSSSGSGEFDFIFKVMTDTTKEFVVGNSIGVILHPQVTPAPDFTGSFSSDSEPGIADTFPLSSVPEPSGVQRFGILLPGVFLIGVLRILRRGGRLSLSAGIHHS
jgi:hypothetical protein